MRSGHNDKNVTMLLEISLEFNLYNLDNALCTPLWVKVHKIRVVPYFYPFMVVKVMSFEDCRRVE